MEKQDCRPEPTVTNAPLLFSQLADLTAMRDIELMEFSLLKTLNGFLMPTGLRILKMDMRGRPCMDIVFKNTQCLVNVEDIVVDDEIKTALGELLVSGCRNSIIQTGDNLLTIYQIHKTRAIHVFLIIVTNKPLTNLNSYLIAGMLQIYRNFCEVIREGLSSAMVIFQFARC